MMAKNLYNYTVERQGETITRSYLGYSKDDVIKYIEDKEGKGVIILKITEVAE